MKLALAILLNSLLLLSFAAWLRAEYRRASPDWRRWLLPALAWRLLLTAASTRWPGPDARHFNAWSQVITANLWSRPAAVLALLQRSRFEVPGQVLELYQWSNNLFFVKLLAMVNLATGGLFWLNSLYLSLGCFIGCWLVVRALGRALPATPPGAGGVAFLLWPTVLWWAGGLTKETVLVGAGAGLVALVLPSRYGRPARPGRVVANWLAGLLLAWLLVRIRYFFALPLLGGLLALAVVRLATRRGWLGPGRGPQAGALLLLLAMGGGAAVALGGRHLELDYFSYEVNANYLHGLRTSLDRPHLAYAHWQPTPVGLLRHAPLAAVQVLVRPWPGESARLLYLGAGLENVLLTSLLGVALVAAWRGRAGRLPVALVVMLAVYCLLLAAFIGLSTPNLGTLHRYRTGLLPWLLLLLLQNDYARRWLRRWGADKPDRT